MVAILRVLARHDTLFMLAWWPAVARLAGVIMLLPGFRRDAAQAGRRDGQRLATALEKLGPAFIKLGQALSTRSDIFGAEVAADLAALQDRLPAFPSDQARAAIENELGQPVSELFSQFDDQAVAAASIAQVHFAVLKADADGEETAVAVKILRPGIEQAFGRDVDLMRWLAEIAERLVPAARRLKPVASVDVFAQTVAVEMDLRLEAAAAEELRANFADSAIYRVPRVFWPLTATRVLTTARIDGIPAHDVPALAAAGHDLEAIVAKAATVFFSQVFEHGFFHADMHPGNLFVGPGGILIPVDFGIMGRVDMRTRTYLADMLAGFLQGDYEKVARVHFHAEYVPPHVSEGAFIQALRAIGDPILERPTNEISVARLLAQLFHVTEQFEMEAQPQLLLLQKTMFLAEGVGRALAPEANMWLTARPLVEAWMIEHRGPVAQAKVFFDEAREVIALLPTVLRKLAEDDAPTPATEKRRRPDGAEWMLWIAAALLVAALLVG